MFIRVHLWIIIFLVAVAFAGCSKKDAAGGTAAVATDAGEAAPDFTLKDIAGNEVSLSDYAGEKVVLISFWATWCVSCREEIPELNRLQREFGGSGLVVLGVNVGESAALAKRFLKGNPAEYAILLDADGEVAQLKYHLYGLPTIIVVGRDGAVAYRDAALPKNPKKYFGKLLKD